MRKGQRRREEKEGKNCLSICDADDARYSITVPLGISSKHYALPIFAYLHPAHKLLDPIIILCVCVCVCVCVSVS